MKLFRYKVHMIMALFVVLMLFTFIYMYTYRTRVQQFSVTRIIHQSWKTKDISQRFQNYSKSWTHSCYKDWKYMFWTDEDNYNLIAQHYPWFIDVYKSLPEPIYRADVSRYFYMFHYGGIYTDLDNECLKPFEHLLDGYAMVFGAMEGQYGDTSLKEGYVQNSFMYSTPRHEFWMELIHEIIRITTAYDGADVPEAQTGPIVLSNTLRTFRARNRSNKNVFKIYPPDYFNPFSWLHKEKSSTHCKDLNNMDYDDWQKCKASMIRRGSYVVQYHAHTW